MESSEPQMALDVNIYNFSVKFGDTIPIVHYHVMKMDQSLFIWIGTSLNLENLAVAIGKDGPPSACKIMGDMTEATQSNLALKLCKRTGKQTFVSYSVPTEIMPDLVEKRLIEEMSNYPEKF